MCDAVVKLSHKNTKVHEISKVKKGHNFENIIGRVTELHMEKDKSRQWRVMLPEWVFVTKKGQ